MDEVREEDLWAERWANTEGERELEEAIERLRSLRGVKKKLMYKAVINYIRSMVGDG